MRQKRDFLEGGCHFPSHITFGDSVSVWDWFARCLAVIGGAGHSSSSISPCSRTFDHKFMTTWVVQHYNGPEHTCRFTNE